MTTFAREPGRDRRNFSNRLNNLDNFKIPARGRLSAPDGVKRKAIKGDD
jgi:hypothetical protein